MKLSVHGEDHEMSDVKLERKEQLSRQEAAVWLHALSNAFKHGGRVELPVGGSTLLLQLPEEVRAEFEVEVSGTDVEVEVEFKWSTAAEPKPVAEA
jgi:amphi-Trp domain-containing protein